MSKRLHRFLSDLLDLYSILGFLQSKRTFDTSEPLDLDYVPLFETLYRVQKLALLFSAQFEML